MGFHAKLVFNQGLGRPLRKADIEEICRIKDRTDRIEKALKLYYEEVKFLAQNRLVDVIACVLPKNLCDAVSKDSPLEEEEQIEASISVPTELNFRRALKAKTMHFGKPLQLIRAISLVKR